MEILKKIKKPIGEILVHYKSFLMGFITLVVFLLIAPYIFSGFIHNEFDFNQHHIEKLDKKYDALNFEEGLNAFVSSYFFKVSGLFNKKSSEKLDFENPEKVFEHVFKNLPNYAIVYPTEMYYYFKFPLGDREVSGNLRLVELENGKLTMGYFYTTDVFSGDVEYFSQANGLSIKRISKNLFKLKYLGKPVFFKISDIWDDYPKKTTLLESEEFITKVRDESGIIFYLVFNKESNVFYYILDEERKVVENLVNLESQIVIGEMTRFAYYLDKENNRKILFGVFLENVINNNYFDGPFDQVYPFVDIGEKLRRSYPYTKIQRVDKFGFFIDNMNFRIAITPYLNYKKKEELIYLLENCRVFEEINKNRFLDCLTYETQRSQDLFYMNGSKMPI